MSEQSRTPLFFQQRFWPMWTAFALGAFADNLLRQTLIVGIPFGGIHVEGIANPASTVPVVGALFAIAMLTFSPIAGQIAEKYETSMLFRRIKFAEVLLMAIAALGLFINSGWLLIVTMVAMGAQSAFFSPVRMGAMPKYLAADELVRGNGIFSAGLFVSILIGLFLGGLLIGMEKGRLMIAALLFAASLFGWLAVLKAPSAPATAPDIKIDWNIFAQGARAMSFAFKAPGVSRPTLGAAFFFFVSTLVTVNVTFYVRTSLGGDEALATAIMGLFAIGAGLGAGGASVLSKKKSGLGFSTLGISGAALCALAVYLLTPAAPAPGVSAGYLTGSAHGVALGFSFFLCSVFMGLYVVPLQAATQRRAPPRERGRIMAASNMMNAAFAMTGSLSVAVVTQNALAPHTAFLAIAALMGAVAGYMILRRNRVPEGLHDELFVASDGKVIPRPVSAPAQG